MAKGHSLSTGVRSRLVDQSECPFAETQVQLTLDESPLAAQPPRRPREKTGGNSSPLPAGGDDNRGRLSRAGSGCPVWERTEEADMSATTPLRPFPSPT